jgi:CRP-like cAMP-binding protein
MQERAAPVNVRATETCQVLRLERGPFRHLLRRYPFLGIELLERMISRPKNQAQ